MRRLHLPQLHQGGRFFISNSPSGLWDNDSFLVGLLIRHHVRFEIAEHLILRFIFGREQEPVVAVLLINILAEVLRPFELGLPSFHLVN